MDPTTIPPRRWLLGNHLVPQGGAGKTTWSIAASLSMATGQGLLGEKVFEPVPVWLFNLEDPMEEMQRRIAAAMLHHGVEPEEVEGRLYVNSGRDRALVVARHDALADRLAYPDKGGLVEQARRLGIGLIVVDPFIASHELDENSNVQMSAAARAWAEVAHEADCAVLLVHHTRKGVASGPAADIEGGRGAKALSDAARVGLTLAPMTREEAEGFGLDEKARRQCVRLDDAKVNLAPKAEDAKWFRLNGVPLGNTSDPTYPNGDNVQAISAWSPPDPLAETSEADQNRVLDMIKHGLAPGVRYCRSRRGNSKRYVGFLLADKLKLADPTAKVLLNAWLRDGVLVEEEYENKNQGKLEKGLFVVEGKRRRDLFPG